jgi:carbonic anhydrase/acetyltransferase-like protein (isoleucine patch superfamily)
VHGCVVKDNVLIGMGAIVMDNCVIESNSIVAAGAVVTQKNGWVGINLGWCSCQKSKRH